MTFRAKRTRIERPDRDSSFHSHLEHEIFEPLSLRGDFADHKIERDFHFYHWKIELYAPSQPKLLNSLVINCGVGEISACFYLDPRHLQDCEDAIEFEEGGTRMIAQPEASSLNQKATVELSEI